MHPFVWIALLAAADLEKQTARLTVKASSEATGPALREFHSWTVSFGSGQAIDAVAFEANMPDHGHGLATQPTIRRLANGTFLVEGVRFHMTGKWVLSIRFHDRSGWDSVSLPFEVESAVTSLWIRSRKGLRPDPSNRFADNAEAAALGKRLFEDKRLSGDGSMSCATCHVAEKAFADNKQFSLPGLRRNTPGLLGIADASWFYWDGRRDSLWSQALAPIEASAEMKGNRQAAVDLLRTHYRAEYEKLAGSMDGEVDRIFANLGKFIAAYERTLAPAPSRFDRYVEGVGSLTPDELAGLEIFLKPASQCMNCHNGPLFTNHSFHNIGTAALEGPQPDFGRAMGVQALAFDAFNCRSAFSDAAGSCPAQDHALAGDHDGLLTGAFKTPTLRNVALTAPYFHDGSKARLEDVIEHYRNPPKVRSELKPLRISDAEARQLVAFLKSLTSVPDAVQVPRRANE